MSKIVFGGEWVSTAMTSRRFRCDGRCEFCLRVTAGAVWFSIKTGRSRCRQCFSPIDEAPPRTFWSYLIAQRTRHDPIGDLSRDALADAAFPRFARQLEWFLAYLEASGACDDALQALREAWREWKSMMTNERTPRGAGPEAAMKAPAGGPAPK